MSDSEEYQERPEAEWKVLEGQFGRPVGRPNYVAQPAPGHDVHGIWHSFEAGARTGYAAHAVALHWALNEGLGVPTELVPHRNIAIDIDQFPDDRKDALFAWHKRAVGFPHVHFSSFPPEVSSELAQVGTSLVPYCAFEGTRVSEFTRDLCNGPAFRSIWVVSDFVRHALIASGVSPNRVRMVPPAVCDGFWAPAFSDLKSALSASESDVEEPFLFGTMGTWHVRKGMLDLLRAYFGEFKRTEPVVLVIRTSAFGKTTLIRELKETITADIATIAREFGDDGFPTSQRQPRVRLELGTEASDAEVIKWLGSLDTYVNASYGEGLGIPHIWAKAQGVPFVSTGYGAVGELLTDLASPADRIIPHMLEAVDPWLLKAAVMFDSTSQWGRYDPADLGRAMRTQFDRGHRRDSLAALEVRNRFSLPRILPTLRAALRELVDVEMADAWAL